MPNIPTTVCDCVSKPDELVFFFRTHLVEAVDVLTGALLPTVVGVIESERYVLALSELVCVLIVWDDGV